MILIDALYINDGGGKILLDYLISELNNLNIEVVYLLDERIIGNHPEINAEKVIYLKGSFIKRQRFYLKNKNNFSKVFCFGNLPPNIRLKAEVFTYFHNLIYLDTPRGFSMKERIKFKLKKTILERIIKNTDYWMVQSNITKEKFQSKFSLTSESIKVLPFYPQFEPFKENVFREKNTYLYVSNAIPYKNHKRLVQAFCCFFDKFQKGKLILTVSKDFPEVLNFIENKKAQGYPIENIGFVNRLTLQRVYCSSEFFIFPSLTESFGLGLIEAIECGCKVIGADLPYTYEVCEPSLVFNPLDEKSIFCALEQSSGEEELRFTVPRIENNINKIISLLK